MEFLDRKDKDKNSIKSFNKKKFLFRAFDLEPAGLPKSKDAQLLFLKNALVAGIVKLHLRSDNTVKH